MSGDRSTAMPRRQAAATPIIELDHVSQIFGTKRGAVHAVNDVSLTIAAGEVLCLVGESGSGKTTTAKMIAGLRPPTAGRMLYDGQEIAGLKGDKLAEFRRAVQIVHQDPYASLNPIRTIYQTLSAPLLKHKIVTGRRAAEDRAKELLQLVGLTPPANFLHAYPHNLSGGQRQRVSVARALTLNPRVIVADEAVSMIDVSLRVSILNLLLKLREELGVTFLFITHDLAIAKYFAWTGHIGVMYLGRLVEYGRTPGVIADPSHPYTRALLAAIPEPDPDLTRTKEELQLRSADLPSLLRLPPGCAFHPRCPLWEEGLCDVVYPDLVPIAAERYSACHVVARERTGHIARLETAQAAD
ncbi:MAG: Oligopeptide transport ATP-binding protein OppF [uncultured Thermomicrobiales bacterium]|uniref:Oligopeptide transport ATP-binding protein OppF n=1 Tax=uncultured Thermomicrobiales bacterium TaxID=1645740 RepID=A0A6J4VN01_9BACT|nr:MAG: Oligopeptide transport ATP-binding protein OppF [uncultured Thermomicrobiales bacterium]